MKVRILAGGVVLLGAVGLIVGQPAAAQSEGDTGGDDMRAAMKEWMQLAKPGEHHKRLKPFLGSWKITNKTFWAGPSGPASETGGTAETKWILDGRFIQETVNTSMMMPTEQGTLEEVPYEGISTIGYDNYQNMYVGTWMDSMGTALVVSRGMLNPTTKTFTFYAQMDEPMMKVYGRMIKIVWRFDDADKHVMEMYDLHAGDDYKVMEITYERQ